MPATRRESLRSTHAIDYTVLHSKHPFLLPGVPHYIRACTLLEATIANGAPFGITCVECFGNPGVDAYYTDYAEQFTQRLRSHFPYIQDSCAYQVAGDFLNILRAANVTHHCPNNPRQDVEYNPLTIFHTVKVNVQPTDAAAIRASFEEAGPKARPATKESVRELLKARIEEVDRVESQCVICMEEMEARSTLLMMPCSHLFHEACLVQWLNNGHLCPLCRYKMPSEY